jgi:hypothetical protein
MSQRILCKHLRTKSMYISAPTQGAPPPSAEGSVSGSSAHFWCNCTLTVTGPDERPVGQEACQAGRGCFED